MKTRVYRKTIKNLEKKEEFRKIFCLMLLSIMITLFLFVMVSMNVLKPILEEKAVQEAESSFLEVEIEVSFLLEKAKETAIQVLLDHSCSPLLTATNTEMLDPETQSRGVGQLGVYQSVNDNIQSIYLFNGRVECIFSTEAIRIYKEYERYPDQEFLEWMIQPENIRVPIKRTISVTRENGMTSQQDVYTYVLPNHYKDGIVENAVVVNMSLENLAAKLNKYLNQEDVYVAVMDSKDVLVQVNTISPTEPEELMTWARQIVEKGIYKENKVIAGEKYSLICYYSDTAKMHFVMIRPWSSIYGIVNYIKEMFLLFMIVLLALGALLSLFTSRSVHAMILSIDGERKEFKGKLQSNIKYRQAKFWQRYLMGVEYYSQADLHKTLEELEISDCKSGALSMLYLESTEIFCEGKKMGMDDVVNAYLKELQELAPVFLFQQKNWIVFLQQRCEEEQCRIYEQGVGQLREKIPCNLNLLGNGNKERCLIEQYPEIYERITEAAKQVFFYPYNLFLDYHRILDEHRNISNHSRIQLVNQISEAITRGEIGEAAEILDQFETALKEESFESYQNHMFWLVMSVTNAVSTVGGEKGNFEDFIIKMHDCPRCTQMHQEICEYFELLAEQYSKKNSRLLASGRIHEIKAYVEEHYHDCQLSADIIAEYFGFSTDYLRKIYKAATGQSVAEYITQVRLEHAAEKVKNTKKSLQEIAVSCGYLNVNYFYTCFKKKYGVTPGNYRAMNSEGQKTREECRDV